MIFIEKPAKLASLSKEIGEKLGSVPDYPLDYNIFLFKGIKESREENEEELTNLRLDIFQSIPEEYGTLVFKGIEESSDGKKKLIPTTTSKLQDRLLEFLVLERHRRDIEILNKMLDTKPDNDKQITLIELKDPSKYEIKSPIFKSFQSNKDSHKSSFKKFTILQNIEYDFEHVLDDDGDIRDDNDLVEMFCNDDILGFNKIFEGKTKEDQDKIVDDLFNDSKIGQVLIPLASRALLLGEEEND